MRSREREQNCPRCPSVHKVWGTAESSCPAWPITGFSVSLAALGDFLGNVLAQSLVQFSLQSGEERNGDGVASPLPSTIPKCCSPNAEVPADGHGSTCAGLGLAQPREGTRRLPAAPLRRQHRLRRAANAPASPHGPRCSPERGVRAGTALHPPAAAGEQLPCNSLGTPTDPHLYI